MAVEMHPRDQIARGASSDSKMSAGSEEYEEYSRCDSDLTADQADQAEARPAWSLLSMIGLQSMRSSTASTPTTRTSGLKADFIQVEKAYSVIPSRKSHRARRYLRKGLQTQCADAFLGIVILVDIFLGCYEVDASGSGSTPPGWSAALTACCVGVYVLELAARLLAQRKEEEEQAFWSGWAIFDGVVVLGSVIDLVIQAQAFPRAAPDWACYLRLVRIIRLLRIFRKFSMLNDLHKLVKMTKSAARTLFWSFVFCFTLMTFWSMTAVLLLHPLAQELASTGVWADCPLCAESMSSVMKTNLLFFKTSVAGDEWGVIAEPMIQAFPWTAIIFMGAFLTLVFGVLNLVVAVVVDEFAVKRENDFRSKAKELDQEHAKNNRELKQIFAKVDQDDNGELSLQELIDGAKRVPEFRDRLRVMDIDEADLEQLFVMLDDDGSGTIDPQEFMGALSRWMHDSRTASRFVKYNLVRAMDQQDKIQELLSKKFEHLEAQVKEASHHSERLEETLKAGAGADAAPLQSTSAKIAPGKGGGDCPTILGQVLAAKSLESLQLALKQAEEALAESMQKAKLALEEQVVTNALDSVSVLHQALQGAMSAGVPDVITPDERLVSPIEMFEESDELWSQDGSVRVQI